MNDQKKSTLSLVFTIIGLIGILHSLYIQVLWINAFNAGQNATERSAIFADHFPASLGLRGVTMIDLAICLVAIAAGSLALSFGNYKRRKLNISILVVGILLALLKVWGLL